MLLQGSYVILMAAVTIFLTVISSIYRRRFDNAAFFLKKNKISSTVHH